MKIPKIPLAQTVIQLCKSKGITHIVISPGSRSAPLTIGFTNDPFFTTYSIVDERCAAFFALGIAQQLQKPTAVVCTSGSALLNYYPAIAEAYYSNIPMVVLSADRPAHLIDIGDGQTINQAHVYGTHVHYSANLKEDNNHLLQAEKQSSDAHEETPNQGEVQTHNETEINAALNMALQNSGPVHINIPFAEPLYETLTVPSVHTNNIPLVKDKKALDPDHLNTIVKDWNAAGKILILIGSLHPGTIDQQWIDKVMKLPNVLVLTETTSNCHHPDVIANIDQLIAPLDDIDFQDLQPDLLITLGGMIVSKKIKAFLRNYSPKAHWHVGENKANDTFFKLSLALDISPNTFFESVLTRIEDITSEYQKKWLALKAFRKERHEAYVAQIPFCDFTVFDRIITSLPKAIQLQLGNSSAIRYLQLFDIDPAISVFCNRGTSGIDGSTSTAIGASVISEVPTIFITGDLSFFYDSNALWNDHIPNTFRIVLINNAGGGIFRILPGHKDTANFDTFFETKHELHAEHLCAMYDFEYVEASDEKQLDQKLATFYQKSDRPRLLEIKTPSKVNDAILLRYFDFIKNNP